MQARYAALGRQGAGRMARWAIIKVKGQGVDRSNAVWHSSGYG